MTAAKGRPYRSWSQTATWLVSVLLLLWGFIWVYYVTSYGVCEQELHLIKEDIRVKEKGLAKYSFEAEKDVWELATRMQEMEEAAQRAKDQLMRYRVAVVVLCTSPVLSMVPKGLFVLHAVTDDISLLACKINSADRSDSVVIDVVKKAPPQQMIRQATTNLFTSFKHPLDAVIIIDEGVTSISPDSFSFLHSVASHNLLSKDLPFSFLGTPITLSKPPSPVSLLTLVHTTSSTPSGVFMASSSTWQLVSKAWKDSTELQCIAPLVPRIFPRVLAHQQLPVLFSAVDLSYLRAPDTYADWLREQAAQAHHQGSVTNLKLVQYPDHAILEFEE
eukprot:TRINITY_DN1720_c1_g2_i1.p1 TRINITY_DN1720_c1_g2~~TRINITY_DN1720_c1_g2_i1.p1  ORF type:complete len:332 (+),score=52.80 TRINITY_DN1720_c1_g2_i1:36-1031(+)